MTNLEWSSVTHVLVMRGDASKLENSVLKDNIRHKFYKQLMDKTNYLEIVRSQKKLS